MPRPTTVVCLALASLMALPASAEWSAQAIESEAFTLSDTTLALEGEALHPTNYPHRHVRRRRVRRVRRHPHHHAAPAHGGFGDGRGSIYVGIGGLGNFFIQADSDASRVYQGGGGFDIMFGARFNRFFALELNYLLLFQSTQASPRTGQTAIDATLQSISLDGKIFVVPSSERIEPFIQVGIGAYLLSELFREELSGVGFDLGAGVDIRFTDFLALGLRAVYRGFYVDNRDSTYSVVATEAAFLSTISGEANIQFHF